MDDKKNTKKPPKNKQKTEHSFNKVISTLKKLFFVPHLNEIFYVPIKIVIIQNWLVFVVFQCPFEGLELYLRKLDFRSLLLANDITPIYSIQSFSDKSSAIS